MSDAKQHLPLLWRFEITTSSITVQTYLLTYLFSYFLRPITFRCINSKKLLLISCCGSAPESICRYSQHKVLFPAWIVAPDGDRCRLNILEFERHVCVELVYNDLYMTHTHVKMFIRLLSSVESKLWQDLGTHTHSQ